LVDGFEADEADDEDAVEGGLLVLAFKGVDVM
jgi:hypothetical protein